MNMDMILDAGGKMLVLLINSQILDMNMDIILDADG
jgi:hypothetical protein